MYINRVSDPVFKNRVVFVKEPQPAARWIMIIGITIIVSLLYVMIYRGSQNVSDNTSMVEPAAVIPNNITNRSFITHPVTHDDEEAMATPSLDQTTKASVSPVTSSTNLSEPAKVAAASENLTQSHETVKRLLAKAQTQIAKTRLTSPPGDNAYETYQKLLKMAPQSAPPVLERIVTWYFEQGQKYIRQGRLTQPNKYNAYKMYQKIHQIAPQHQVTQTLVREIFNTLSQRAEQQIQQDQLVTPINDNAYTTYQEMLTVAPNQQKTRNLFKTIVNRLLAKAKQQMAKYNYTTPKGDNAADTYQALLKISSNNVDAHNGIKTIVEKYYRLAANKYRQGQYAASLIWIERGLGVVADDEKLINLKQEVEQKMSP